MGRAAILAARPKRSSSSLRRRKGGATGPADSAQLDELYARRGAHQEVVAL